MKKNRLIKYALLVFIVIYGITCFASIVDDYDGAAFVTKQEFEELKMEILKCKMGISKEDRNKLTKNLREMFAYVQNRKRLAGND